MIEEVQGDTAEEEQVEDMLKISLLHLETFRSTSVLALSNSLSDEDKLIAGVAKVFGRFFKRLRSFNRYLGIERNTSK